MGKEKRPKAGSIMTASILEKPTAQSIAGELSIIQDYLRITHELVVDQLCNVSINDPVSVWKTHERLEILIELIPKKLQELELLGNALFAIDLESKAVSNL